MAESFGRGTQFGLFHTPRENKMYQDLKLKFWWNAMKREIAQYVAKCLVCQQIKVEHQRTADFYNHYLYLNGSENISP